jgi:hypothetical protein
VIKVEDTSGWQNFINISNYSFTWVKGQNKIFGEYFQNIEYRSEFLMFYLTISMIALSVATAVLFFIIVGCYCLLYEDCQKE